MEIVTNFIFLGSEMTADCDCSHKIKRRLLLGRKTITKPCQFIKKHSHYFADQVKALVFPLVMYRCESWTKKKVECRRTAALKLCWGRLLRVPWTARSHKSIQKEIHPEYSLEGPMLKLKLQFFGHLI